MRAAKQSNPAAAAAPLRIAAEFRVVVLQLIFALSAALLCLSIDAAWRSVLLGASCVLLPTAYAAWRSCALPGIAHRLWSSMLAIEIQKLLFMAALFAICFIALKPQSPLAFFVAVIGCQAMYLVAAVGSKPGARSTVKTALSQ